MHTTHSLHSVQKKNYFFMKVLFFFFPIKICFLLFLSLFYYLFIVLGVAKKKNVKVIIISTF